MSRHCLVCNTPHLEMISILRHPRDLDSMLRSLLGLQANHDDYLCKSCCSEIRNAFDSKQKLYKFNQLESEVLGSDWTVIKDEVDPGDYIENVVSARDPVVNIEPQSDDLKEALKMIDGSTGTRCNEMFKSDFDLHLGAKLQPGADNEYKSEAQRTVWATVGGESDTTELKETRSSSSEFQGAFNIVTPDAACIQSGSEDCLAYFKREKSVDIEENTREEKLDAEREDTIKTINSSESREVAVASGEKKLIFHCEVCNSSYLQIDHFQNHFKREHPDIQITNTSLLQNPYKCSYCSKAFATNIKHQDHVRTHTKEKPYVCCERGKGFITPSKLKDNEMFHTGEKPYKCSECGKCFTTSSKLKIHNRIHTGKKPYKCLYCGKCFATSGERYTHTRTSFITSSRLEDHKSVHTGEKPFKCCTTSSQRVHLKKHTNDEKECEQNGSHNSKDCWEYFKREKSVEIDDSTVENKPNTEREDIIKTVENSESEEIAVSGGQAKLTFYCEVCNNSYCQIGSLQNHFKREHPNITIKKPFVCSECGKCFTVSSELKVHIRIHTGEKPYKCLYCSKMFAKSYVYQNHVRTHKNEKPYICSECGKGFAGSYVLTVHERTHTGEKPYKCCECGKCFTSSSKLKTHNRIHTGEKPYKCLYCSKTCATSDACRVHMRTHTNERPYVCHECGKGFITSSGLKLHERTHTGAKPQQQQITQPTRASRKCVH